MSEYIVGILKPSNKESRTDITEGLVLDAELLDHVFKVPITTVKCCYFSQDARYMCIGPRIDKNVDGSALGSFSQGRGDFLEEGATGNTNTNIKQCLRKVIDGYFTVAVKVLSSSGVAPYCTSCKRDGLKAQHILDALCGEGSATATDLLKVITLVVNLWLVGRCPPILSEFVAMKGVDKEMSKYLSDFQFGVGVSGGAEAILHSINRVLSEYHNDGSLSMLNVDLSNALNLVDRSTLLHEVRVKCPSISLWVNFLYGQASRLYIGDTQMWSGTGVQQGDPLRPLLFALILHPLLYKIKDSFKLLLHAWYLDDGWD
nr:putative reverse transcriptase domain-containing protein [Tanacetum cinerariifolium]